MDGGSTLMMSLVETTRTRLQNTFGYNKIHLYEKFHTRMMLWETESKNKHKRVRSEITLGSEIVELVM